MSSNRDFFCFHFFPCTTDCHSGWVRQEVGGRKRCVCVQCKWERGRNIKRRGEEVEWCQARCQHAGLAWKTMSAAAATGQWGVIRLCIGHITFTGKKKYAASVPHTYRCWKPSRATAGLCNRTSVKMPVQQHSIVKQRAQIHMAPQCYTSKKSQWQIPVYLVCCQSVPHFSQVHWLGNSSALTCRRRETRCMFIYVTGLSLFKRSGRERSTSLRSALWHSTAKDERSTIVWL